MKNEQELIENMKIIFTQENFDFKNGYTRRFSSNNELVYENAQLLIDLFFSVSSNKKLKQKFIDTLENNIQEQRRLITKAISFFTLTKVGFTDIAIKGIANGIKEFHPIMYILNNMLDDIIDYFSKEQLADLFYRINSLANYQADEKIKATVLEKLSKKRINHLKEHLKSNNQEINQDRKNLSDKIKKLELNANYNLLLDQIDKYLETADSGAITAGMINTLRQFIHDMIIEISKKIEKKTKELMEKPSKDKTQIKIARDFIKKHLDLSDKDNKFIDSFINILHSEGGHAFMSEKEYFRLSRNIGVEIGLFIVSKYEKLVK